MASTRSESGETERIQTGFAMGKERILLQAYIPYLLARTSNAVAEATSKIYLDALSQWAPLNKREYRVLLLLADQTSLSPASASELTGMDKATITRSIRGLKRYGLVETLRNTRDGRGKYITLTPAGADACDKIVPLMRECGDIITSSLTPDEKKQLIRLIAKVEQNVSLLSQAAQQQG